jgi:thiol-disulfide isomerase/thioredoxin
MFLKLWKSISQNHTLLFIALFLKPVCLLGADFEYFDKGVDFWNETKASTPSSPSVLSAKKAPIANVAPNDKTEKFPWEQYLDPKNKEFFKEGDYTPPEPFMELVRNPSDENMKMWFAYIEKKNELSVKLQERMNEYLAKNGLTLPPDKKKALVSQRVVTPSNIDVKRYRLRIYFSSTCPHCQKMMGTLTELQSKGFFIEARQIDSGNGPSRLPFPVEMATKEELKIKDIQSVPLLLIGDLKKKVVYRLTGYQSTDSVLKAMSQEDNGT